MIFWDENEDSLIFVGPSFLFFFKKILLILGRKRNEMIIFDIIDGSRVIMLG